MTNQNENMDYEVVETNEETEVVESENQGSALVGAAVIAAGAVAVITATKLVKKHAPKIKLPNPFKKKAKKADIEIEDTEVIDEESDETEED